MINDYHHDFEIILKVKNKNHFNSRAIRPRLGQRHIGHGLVCIPLRICAIDPVFQEIVWIVRLVLRALEIVCVGLAGDGEFVNVVVGQGHVLVVFALKGGWLLV